jgi:hypothetical protein
MKAVALATLSFAALMVTPPLLLASTALFFQHPQRPDALGDFAVAAYFVFLSSSLATIGFLIPTALSAAWRGLAARRAAIIAGSLGLVAPVVVLLVAAVGAAALVPLFRSIPWLAATLFHAVPGIVLGVAALLIARAFPTPAKR